jgi:hypothetical protein
MLYFLIFNICIFILVLLFKEEGVGEGGRKI